MLGPTVKLRRDFTTGKLMEDYEMICFYCSNQINTQHQSHVHATVEHNYKYGGSRLSDRRFHLKCFDKFLEFEGRPYNPHTDYNAYNAVVERAGEILYELDASEAE
jgi:hypothetical protein